MIKKEFLESTPIYSEINDDNSYNVLNCLGMYVTDDFTIRLAHNILDQMEKTEKISNRVVKAHELDFETIQAYSTYFHETIHWWQHIGSTSGFILSLIFPAQFHSIHYFLIKILENKMLDKSIAKYNQINAKVDIPNDALFQNINNTLNNYHDMLFFRSMVVSPNTLLDISKSYFFVSCGHITACGYINVLNALKSTFDPGDNSFLKVETIIKILETMQKRVETPNAYNTLMIPPVGVKELYEGQACFQQMLYLHFASGGQLNFKEFREDGIFYGIYAKAFEVFIEITKSTMPDSINDPLVGLFLLVCDIAINPGEGFPFGVENEDLFFENVIPGVRFYYLCLEVKELIDKDEKFTVKEYSKQEYEYLSDILCNKLNYKKPKEIFKEIVSWKESNQKIKEVLEQEKLYEFNLENLPIRVLLAKFIKLAEDKLKHPEFFCWAGVYMAGPKCMDKYSSLVVKHQALFINRKDMDIYPVVPKGIQERKAADLLNGFFQWNIIYNLTAQWILKDGDFDLDFVKRFTSKSNAKEIKEFSDKIFRKAFNIGLDDIKII